MEERKLLEDFFRSFKASLTNAGIYPKQHPFFKNSVKQLKDTLDKIFLAGLNPVHIGITSNSLLVEGEYFDKDKVHIDLAYLFHHRKIKKITISQDITIQDFLGFLSIMSLPLKDVMKERGIRRIMEKEGVQHIDIEELDYSELLGISEGEENKDIWKFLIDDVYKKKDLTKELEDLINNFEGIMGKFSPQDLVDGPTLLVKIIGILRYLKHADREKFERCKTSLVRFILKAPESLKNEEVLNEAKNFFEDVGVDELTKILWEDNFENKKFNPLIIETFSKLLSADKQKKIADSIAEGFKKNKELFRDPDVKRRFDELISSFDNYFISAIYKNTLLSFIKSIDSEGAISFNEKEIFNSYKNLLLNLLALEDRSSKENLIISNVFKEWDKVIKDRDFRFIRQLLDILDKKVNDSKDKDLIEITKGGREKLLASVEDIIVNKVSSLSDDDFNYFSGIVTKSHLSADTYIKKILANNYIHPRMIKLFFKFFPQDTEPFFKEMKKNLLSLDRAKKTVDVLKYIDSQESLDLLKLMFDIANAFLKVEILKAMQNLSFVDTDFLLDALSQKNIFLNREILIIIKEQSSKVRKEAAVRLLNFSSLLGLKKNILISNIRLIEEEGIWEAKEILDLLSRKFYFWWENDLKETIINVLNKFKKDA